MPQLSDDFEILCNHEMKPYGENKVKKIKLNCYDFTQFTVSAF